MKVSKAAKVMIGLTRIIDLSEDLKEVNWLICTEESLEAQPWSSSSLVGAITGSCPPDKPLAATVTSRAGDLILTGYPGFVINFRK
ncbi:MAG: hypothetical protein JRK53_11630 [Deltaproteobacteria bacterium]|nr:hypothetical protein [Deltaproteobacteria bacterium]